MQKKPGNAEQQETRPWRFSSCLTWKGRLACWVGAIQTQSRATPGTASWCLCHQVPNSPHTAKHSWFASQSTKWETLITGQTLPSLTLATPMPTPHHDHGQAGYPQRPLALPSLQSKLFVEETELLLTWDSKTLDPRIEILLQEFSLATKGDNCLLLKV